MKIAHPATSIHTTKITPSLLLLALFPVSLPFYSVWAKEGLARPDWIIGGLLILSFIFSLSFSKRIAINRVARWVLILNGAAMLSALNLFNAEPSKLQEFSTMWAQLLFVSLFFLAITNKKVSLQYIRLILKIWVFFAFLVAIYGIYQALARNLNWPLAYIPILNPTDLSPSQLSWGLGFGGYIRPSSILREASYLASYLIAPFLLTIIIFFSRRDRTLLFQTRSFNRIIIFVIATCLILSFSLSGYLTMLGVLLFSLFGRRLRSTSFRIGRTLFLSLILVCLALQALGVNWVGATERFNRIWPFMTKQKIESGIMDPSTSTRLTEAIITMHVWARSPLIGVGLNNVKFATQKVGNNVPAWFIQRGYLSRGYVHNMWLQVLAEMGIIGLIALVGVYGSAFILMKKLIRESASSRKVLALAFFYILLANVIKGLMGGTYFYPEYWFVLALSSLIYSAKPDPALCRFGSLDEEAK